MSTTLDSTRFRTGAKVRIPERRSGDGTMWPEVITKVTEDARKSMDTIWVCRVAHWPRLLVRVDQLELIEPQQPTPCPRSGSSASAQ